jgi:ABC-type nitrate/sulfonate/bicarbonate transport system permease component
MRSVADVLLKAVPLLVLLAVWQTAGALGLVTSRLLPAPSAVLAAFVTDIANGVLVQHAAVTVSRALTGFALGAVCGVLLAATMARFAWFNSLFEPLVLLGLPVPKIAFFPIFVFMFGVGSFSKIAFAFVECLFPILVTTYFGIRNINTRLLMTATNYGAGRLMILHRVIVPAALPAIFAGLRIALPVAMIVVVITEMIGDSAGLGYYINIWSTRFRFANVYAGILMVGLIGMALEGALAFARRRAIPWQGSEAEF